MLVVVRSKDPSSNPQRGLSHLVEFHWIAFLLFFFYFSLVLSVQFPHILPTFCPGWGFGGRLGGFGLGWQQEEFSSFFSKPSFFSTTPSSPPPPPPPPPRLEKLPRKGSFVKVFLTMVVVDIVVRLTIVEKLWKDLNNLSCWDRPLLAGATLFISIFSQFSFLLEFVRFLIRP